MKKKLPLLGAVLLIGLTAWAVTYREIPSGLKIGGGYGSTGVTIEDNGDVLINGDLSVDGTFAGGGSGHTIEDEGTPLTARTSLNFTGAGVSAADSGGKTVVTISGGGGGGVTDGDTLSTGFTFPNAGLHLLDTNASHDLILAPGSNITADRTLTITTGDANRTLDMSAGSATVSGTNTGDVTVAGTPDYITISGQVITRTAVDLAADVTGTLPAASVGTGLTDAQVSDTLTASKLIGSGSTTDAVDLATAEVAGTLPDGNVSDTLTASLFVGSGSTTSAIDLATAEVAGTLPDSNVSDTLTASKLVGSGSTTDAVDLATAEVGGDLPLSNIAQFAAGTFAGRALGGGTGDLQAMTNAQTREAISNITALTSTGNAVSWTASGGTKYTHTLSENTTIGASTGAEGQIVIFMITKASTYTWAWNAQFKALDGLTASIPAIPATAGDIGYYVFVYHVFLDDWALLFHAEYQP